MSSEHASITSFRGDLTRRGGLSVLLVEQQIGFALQAAQRYYVLESGRISSSGEGGAGAESVVRSAMAI